MSALDEPSTIQGWYWQPGGQPINLPAERVRKARRDLRAAEGFLVGASIGAALWLILYLVVRAW